MNCLVFNTIKNSTKINAMKYKKIQVCSFLYIFLFILNIDIFPDNQSIWFQII